MPSTESVPAQDVTGHDEVLSDLAVCVASIQQSAERLSRATIANDRPVDPALPPRLDCFSRRLDVLAAELTQLRDQLSRPSAI